MKMSVVELIKLGRRYLQLWPERQDLTQYFAEYRIIQLSRIIYRVLPGMTLCVLLLQLSLLELAQLPQVLVFSLFLASLPVQTLIMLGVKADTFLPPALAAWYKEGVARVNQQGGQFKLSLQKPRYIDLATLLNVSYQQSYHQE